MVQYMTTRLDTSFAALSDATRRGVLEQLGRADASITDLAEKFHMTLTGMKKHVCVLEQAGLVTRSGKHTSELPSRQKILWRLVVEKKTTSPTARRTPSIRSRRCIRASLRISASPTP